MRTEVFPLSAIDNHETGFEVYLVSTTRHRPSVVVNVIVE